MNGSYTSWTWNSNDRRYALWEIAPEARYYIGKEKRGYIGAIYKAGSFNYKLSEIGKQGNLMGGGLTGGYQLKLNKALNLDFSLALGCLHADYDKYLCSRQNGSNLGMLTSQSLGLHCRMFQNHLSLVRRLLSNEA